MIRLTTAALLLLMIRPAADAPDAEGWSRFRGPNGSGVSISTRLPTEFGPEKNVVWKTELPFGHSSPVLTRDRIFLTAVRGDRLVTICLDRRTGRILWERQAPRPRVEKLDTRNGPAGPTPATDGTNVYVFFADFGLLSYDMEGRERWRVPLGPFNNLYGMGASPVLVGDSVILACDQNTDSFIIAVAQRDGRIRWKTPRPEAHSGHSTPILFKPDGAPDADHRARLVPAHCVLRRQRGKDLVGPWSVVRAQIDAGRERGHAVHQWLRDASEPARRPPGHSAVRRDHQKYADRRGHRQAFQHAERRRPLLDRSQFERRDLTSEWDYYRAAMASENGMLAIRLGGRGDVTDTNVRWKYHKSVPQLPSPLVYQQRALHGERRRHRHRTPSRVRRRAWPGPAEGRHRSLTTHRPSLPTAKYSC